MNILRAAVAALFSALLCPAATYLFSMDTAAFSGPYQASFVLIDGGLPANSAFVTGLNLGGGALTGVPVLEGGASTTAEGFSFSDTSLLNRVTQGFNPGAVLSFYVTATFNSTLDIDTFSFSILDTLGNEIPTQGLANELLYMELTDPPLIETYASAGSPSFAQPAITAVPEPWSVSLTLAGLLLFSLRWRWVR